MQRLAIKRPARREVANRELNVRDAVGGDHERTLLRTLTLPKQLTGLVALLRSFEPLPSEQEIVERLGFRCHTLGLRAKNLGVGG